MATTTSSDIARADATKAKADADAAAAADAAKATATAEERKALLDADVFVPKDLQEKAEGIARDELLIRSEAARQQLVKDEAKAQGIGVGKIPAEHVWDVAMTRAVEKVKAEEAGENDVRYTGSDTLIEGAEAVKEFDAANEAKTAKAAKADPKGTPKNTAGETARKAADAKAADTKAAADAKAAALKAKAKGKGK